MCPPKDLWSASVLPGQMCVAEVMAWKSKVSWTSISGFGSAASAFWPSRLEDWSQTAESTLAAEGSALARTST